SSRLASTAMGSARTGRTTGVTRRVGTSSTRLRAARLGAGLTTVAPAPAIDAATAMMTNPEVAEEKRFCPSCGAAVGRSVEGRPGRTEGFCPQCRSPYSFTPKLQPGDVVGGQYEVAGALAHGGLGWIYLAKDRNVSDRWVVLKGLLNTGDADALAAAIAERQFLAQVEHPRIVEIYNFVSHDGEGYTVMEYVGGHSLKGLLKNRMRAAGGRYDPFPLDVAIAYVLEILPAFEYLHDLGLVYCDFKPDNLIQIGDDVKLIDLGGVRRIDDQDSAIYGTVGYQAPEVAEIGTSVASDIYTLGRTLLVLAMEFRGYQSTYVASLPPVDQTPLFQTYDSFYRLVAKACAPDPADRFATVAELRVQLHGVLREVVATDRAAAGPGQDAARDAARSLLFTTPDAATAVDGWQDLPTLRPDTADPQAGWLAGVDVEDPHERLAQLERAPERSPEVLLAISRAGLHAGRYDVTAAAADELLAGDPWEWRAVWLQGLVALATNDGRAAQAAFNAVYGQVPGELAPKLALALACEASGEPVIAEALYGTCARTDAAYVPPAAFAMARIRAARGAVSEAVAALDLVPATSRAYTEARRQRAELLVRSDGGLPALADAMTSIHDVGVQPAERTRLTAAALHAALEHVQAHGPQPAVRIGAWPAAEPELRDGLERTYRELAAAASTPAERIALVDAANDVRRWTLR
ncbi:protein kinase, partial [Actinotalea ferrariae]|uniref:serine/threonine-protein kinase n=1 Tax=Actinotalea ferrariae TaxID=1386098 RepID=UPI001C8B2437